MTTQSIGRQAALRALIQGFLAERLAGKLEKLKPDDPKYEQTRAEFEYAAWIEDAAKRVVQIQAVTHSLKPIHPDAKGSNLFCAPTQLPSLDVVGSHCLGDGHATDVVGNAAALDVYKFLKLTHDGKSLLNLCVEHDPDLQAVLDKSAETADEWMTAFAGLVRARGRDSSHTNAKQFYWLTGLDPHQADSFHLLAPLYATSLAHAVHLQIRGDRFSDEAIAARDARKVGAYSDRPVREYPQMAVQKLGGTKPQNISQLNSERRGDNYLLASLPPVWVSRGIKPLLHVASLFDVLTTRPHVGSWVKQLRVFLKGDPARNHETRVHRDALVTELIDALIHFSAELRELPPGWTQDPACQLSKAQSHWLDPDGQADGASLSPAETERQIAAGFAGWLNQQLGKALSMSDPEFEHWRSLALEEIKFEDWEAAHEQ